ncbi:hypothetical protein Q4577_09975 [Marinovum sp. 2_MG-2023]|uniref:hypothetical protein n=1 Tax=unclassified Marinovum TaxID=2647166 RepID=UPI0026E2B2AA|nr:MULTISPECIES: hypothetical protein [unclassified Marinovum]MDO6730348.1 hypothetical protein [Marinovum sp. 2_MG-2023]MDO6778328.1 hypothetical protein [Marinovum sp. 1_MG-2023]
MARRLTFLIGAHKTASTHLQRSLVANRAALAPEGVGVIGPMPIGADILPLSNLLRGRADPALLALAADGFLTKQAGDAADIVLMNENIVSPTLAPDMGLDDNQFYKFAPGRLKRVLQLFPDHDIRVGMAIRSPDSFLVSAWQENMKGHAFRPFRNYLGQTDVTQLSWWKLVKRLRQAIGDTPLFLWRYEDYPAVVPTVLTHCIGAAAAKVTMQDSAANPGFSAAALEFLARQGQVTKETTADALARFPKGRENPPFQPWNDAELRAMSERYAEDLDKIATRGIATLLRP